MNVLTTIKEFLLRMLVLLRDFLGLSSEDSVIGELTQIWELQPYDWKVDFYQKVVEIEKFL